MFLNPQDDPIVFQILDLKNTTIIHYSFFSIHSLDGVIRFEHVSMAFPGVLANDDISLEIRRGEVFALVGENGAGKSTLMNILYGIYTPTSGEVYIRGERVTEHTPRAAIEAGVGMVHQHFKLVPSFTVAQNIVLSREPRRLGVFFDDRAARAETEKLCAEYGLHVEPDAEVRDLGVGLQQRVEILKALYRGADILILDEPTAVLTPQETDELFAVLRRIVREKNMTVILITHKLYEVMAISDRVGILRQGKLVGVEDTKNVTQASLASMMVGREVLFDRLERTGEPGEDAIVTEDLYVSDVRGLPAVRGVSIHVRAGEVLGIAAIEGNGQSELLETICGLRKPDSGKVYVCGKDVTGKTPGVVREAGLAHIPEDRLSTGVSPEASISDNLLTGRHDDREFLRFGFHLRTDVIRRYTEELYKRYDIRSGGIDTQAEDMSGGNLQKLVVAREFSFDTPVLVIAQPTRGVDIGASEFIHRRIMEKRAAGCAILLSSADLDEVLRLSDRIITLYEGRVTGEFTAEAITREQLGYYMTGDRTQEAST